MAVYTQLGAQEFASIISAYDVGSLVSARGVAEGVSNSNWLIETEDNGGATATTRRFILTMYEKRMEVNELPFFLDLLDHLSARGCAVPRTIHDRDDQSFRVIDGKAIALIEFLPGKSVTEPTPKQAHAVGRALAQIHLAGADFAGQRTNSLGPADWQQLANACGNEGLGSIHPQLPELIARELATLTRQWPLDLPQSAIHADLFPDNVLMQADEVTGLIDFYFACTDIIAYDVAVTHAAWCFSSDGRHFDPALPEALLAGYNCVRAISAEERAALPLLAQGAAMRFLLTRAFDWLNTPADALVTRKDPMAFVRRLEFYASPANAAMFSA